MIGCESLEEPVLTVKVNDTFDKSSLKRKGLNCATEHEAEFGKVSLNFSIAMHVDWNFMFIFILLLACELNVIFLALIFHWSYVMISVNQNRTSL